MTRSTRRAGNSLILVSIVIGQLLSVMPRGCDRIRIENIKRHGLTVKEAAISMAFGLPPRRSHAPCVQHFMRPSQTSQTLQTRKAKHLPQPFTIGRSIAAASSQVTRSGVGDGETAVATDGCRVKVAYKGTLDDGTVFDSSDGKAPVSFEVGAGEMIPGFDAAVKGMRVGETKTFRLEAQDAYGVRDENQIDKVPLDKLPEGVKEGSMLQGQSGVIITVIKIEGGMAFVDANHPLASKALTFSIELVACGPAPKLSVDTLEPGDGKTFPKKGDMLSMHYVGMLAADGTKFDSSRDRGQQFQFKIGVGQVITGWDEGVMKMSLGEKAMLYVPSELGYGARGAGAAIPPNADLVFEVQLLDIQSR